ncbi:hypothetical protein ABVT39_017034 [Epinephelus coioides]
MSANSSSSLDLPQPFSSICFGHRDSNIIFASFTITNIVLLLPLCTTILSLGYQRWRRQRSASTSHSDIITYHMVVMEMICVFGSISYCIGVGFNLKRMMVVACYVILITVCGQISFHVLTCVERYLAVVHPVTYMHLRRGSGVTIRNISICSSPFPDSAVCFTYRPSLLIFTSFSVTSILLLLPLCILVLCLGFQQWRQQRSTAASHSDIFTYHMVTMEIIGIFGSGLYCYAISVQDPWFMMVGVYFFSVATHGQIPFHMLTCVERYLAVIHPITYLGLRKRGGAIIRNVTIGLSVLCALIHSGPGEGGGGRHRVDQSKMRAFYTIVAIMGALVMRFGGQLVVQAIHSSSVVSERVSCGLVMSAVWFGLPSSLVLPLLFLHRAGKLLCCKSNTESGQGSE